MREKFRSEDVIRDGKPEPCPECPQYKTCTQLCEKVERWVSQDRIGKPAAEINEMWGSHGPGHGHLTYASIMSLMSEPYTNDFIDIAKFRSSGDGEKIDKDLSRNAWSLLKAFRLPKASLEFADLYYNQVKTLTQTAAALKISAQAAHCRHQKLKHDIKDRFERIEIWNKIKDTRESWGDNKKHFILMLYFGDLRSPQYISSRYDIHIVTVYKATRALKKSLTKRD